MSTMILPEFITAKNIKSVKDQRHLFIALEITVLLFQTDFIYLFILLKMCYFISKNTAITH